MPRADASAFAALSNESRNRFPDVHSRATFGLPFVTSIGVPLPTSIETFSLPDVELSPELLLLPPPQPVSSAPATSARTTHIAIVNRRMYLSSLLTHAGPDGPAHGSAFVRA